MKNKIISLIVIFTLIMSVGLISNAATEACKITLKPNSTTVKPGDTVKISVNLSDITDADGLAAYAATVSFDKDVFTYSKTTGSGEWETPTYNEGNLVSTVASGMGQTTNQTCAVIELKVNSKAADGEYKVKLSDITVSNGVETLSISSVTTKIKVKGETTKEESKDNTTTDKNNTTADKNNTTSNKNNTTSNKNNTTTSKNTTSAKKDNSTSSKKIPYAGVEQILIPAIIVIALIGTFCYFKYKRTM